MGPIGCPEKSIRNYNSQKSADISYKAAKPQITHSIQSDYVNNQTFYLLCCRICVHILVIKHNSESEVEEMLKSLFTPPEMMS